MSFNKIFMIGWEYPPFNSGGLGVACKGLTQALSDQGTQIYFTLPYFQSGQLSHMQVLSCFDQSWFESNPTSPPFSGYFSSATPLSQLPIDADELHSLPTSQLENKVSQYADHVAQAARTHQDFDIIHAHDWMSFPSAIKVKKNLKKPYIAHVHSTEYDRIPGGHGSQFIIQTEKEGLEQADRVIAVSNYTKQILIKRYLIDPNKIDVVYNGITSLESTASKPIFAQARPLILFLGRLTMQKGAEYFLQLAKRVVSQIPQALFVVAGDGDQFHSLLLKNANLNLSTNLLFTGFVRGKPKNDLLERADVFIMPSLSEPFGLVAVEAAQRNTPVIVSKNSGVSEVMKSAISLDFWDLDKMTDKIVQLLSDKKYANQVKNAQKQDLTKITWQSSATKLRDIYRRAFAG